MIGVKTVTLSSVIPLQSTECAYGADLDFGFRESGRYVIKDGFLSRLEYRRSSNENYSHAIHWQDDEAIRKGEEYQQRIGNKSWLGFNGTRVLPANIPPALAVTTFEFLPAAR